MKLKALNTICVLLTILLLGSFIVENKSIKTNAKSSQFRVIKINGKIYFLKTGSNMKIGDYFIEGTQLKFSSLVDRAAILNKDKGRYILKPNEKGKAKILPAMSNISTRDGVGALINILDIKGFFNGNCLFLGDLDLKLGKESFPLNEDHFFYVTYMYNSELIAKKIPFDSLNNSITISESELYKIDNVQVPTVKVEMILYYKSDKSSTEISSFTPVFPNEESIIKEVAVLLDELREKNFETKEKEIIAFLNEFYGKPQKNNLRIWLENKHGIKIDRNINFK